MAERILDIPDVPLNDLREFISDADEFTYSRSTWLLRTTVRVVAYERADGSVFTVLVV